MPSTPSVSTRSHRLGFSKTCSGVTGCLGVVCAWALSLTAGPALADDAGAPHTVQVVADGSGTRLQVDGRDLMIIGMNWGYIPIGHNYSYSIWEQPDHVVEAALGREMPLLRAMGVNTIKLLAGVPPRWVRYIYERYGIYTVLNHQMARYGFNVDGTWIPAVDYSDPRLRQAVLSEIVGMVKEFRGTPGLIMWLLGNENNYGLSWKSFEIEALPAGERQAARARHLYSMVEEITAAIKKVDDTLPVALANGDIQYIDIIAEECKSLDVFGTNVYRGRSVRSIDGVMRQGLGNDGPLFDVVQAKMGLPVLYTEFGSDAFNAREMREDQVMQAYYLVGQWQELYEQSAGKGGVGNSIGGLIFQWSDGWWKFGQQTRLDIHDTNASWPNGGYYDHVPGENNMNEEWWGICAKGPPDGRGLYEIYPRAAYFALKQAFSLDAYGPATSAETIRAHFEAIDPATAELAARGTNAKLGQDLRSRVRLAGLELKFETMKTGGSLTSTPAAAGTAPTTTVPGFRGFDQLESVFATFEANPSPNVTGQLSLNVLGNVPLNPINEIFYENRGRPLTVTGENGTIQVNDAERLKIYRAGLSWDERWFLLDGFYRTGHFHWGYEGDFFGLYREANYGENIDIYNGEAPVGFELAGKRALSGLKAAIGPQLWWGANPALLLKYQSRAGNADWTAIYQEDLDPQTATTSSVAVPVPPTRKATLHVATNRAGVGIELGGIWSGSNKVGDSFQIFEERDGQPVILRDEVRDGDAFGAKAKVTYQQGRWNWYAQGAVMGLVADGGPIVIQNYTGWHLRDSGLGNQNNFLTGLAVNLGTLQIAPNFLWQEPIAGPIPGDAPSPGRPRNVLDDPFAVRANREMVAAELMLAFDPTPETWMWQWDNDVREDAKLAASLALVVKDYATTQDAAIGILGDGRTTFAFPGAPPARRVGEAHLRVVSRPRRDLRIVAHAYGANGEPNGESTRLVHRYGADARVAWKSTVFSGFAKRNDWGPYDYHRDFNLTFPLQLMGDVSYTLGRPQWFAFPQTRVGLRSDWRSLDEHSPRYCPATTNDALGNAVCDPTAEGATGSEWELRTYLHFAL